MQHRGFTVLDPRSRPGATVPARRDRPLLVGHGGPTLHLRGYVPACLRASHGRSRRAGRGRPLLVGHGGPTLHAFTLVELVIVITVIILILAIAVPGLSAMTAEARLTSAQQTIQGMTTQAYYLALANRAMTAVRFFPGEWDTVDPSQKRVPGGRQHLAIYSYTAVNPDSPLLFSEHFERAKDLTSATLPEDVWTAPLEALQVPAGQTWLDGALCTTANSFVYDAIAAGPNFLNADDFLIVCDPQTGMRTGMPTAFHLRAYVPNASYLAGGLDSSYCGFENTGPSDSYQRYSFSGVVTYRREPFTVLGASAGGIDRQRVLQESGRPFMVHRFSGGLLPGLQRPASP